MGRLIAGIVAGILSALVTIVAIEMIRQAVYPPPAGININSHRQMSAYILGMPVGAHALIAFAWFAGAADGGFVAALISRRYWTTWLIAVLTIGVAVANVAFYDHPLILQFAALGAPLLGGLVASILARRLAGPAFPDGA